MKTLLFLIGSGLSADFGVAQDSLRWRIEGGLTFSHFQQQVKSEIGGERGERLVNETEVGFLATGTYHVWEFFHVGVFLQFDRGNRLAARFSHFDPATGRTVTKDKVGGDYDEFWLGPLARAQWRNLFGEAGWAIAGFRNDDARNDLRTTSGDTTGTLSLLPSVALFASLGTSVDIVDKLGLVIRLEYRLRYYEGREGREFANGLKHGTQNITPFVGLSWQF